MRKERCVKEKEGKKIKKQKIKSKMSLICQAGPFHQCCNEKYMEVQFSV